MVLGSERGPQTIGGRASLNLSPYTAMVWEHGGRFRVALPDGVFAPV